MSLYKFFNGKIFEDDFSTLNSKWEILPNGCANITERPGYIRINHIQNINYLLFDLPNIENIAIEAEIEYFPTQQSDMGGLVIWESSSNTIEILESYDNVLSSEYTQLRAIKTGITWKFYGKKDNVWEFISVESFSPIMAGFVLKGDLLQTGLIPLDINKVTVCVSDKLYINNILENYKVELYDSNNILIDTKIIEPMKTRVEITLPSLPFNGTIKVYDTLNNLIENLTNIFYGGDIYNVGTYLQVLKDGIELSLLEDTFLGNMYGGFSEIKLTLYNPSSSFTATNINIQILQYSNKNGYQYVDIAHDNAGSPGIYYDNINITSLAPNASIDFWIKIEVTESPISGDEPYTFILDINHD